MPISLPVDAVLPELLDALAQYPSAVLRAPTGAGKTTRVPPALLKADWLEGQQIIMLEPRRLAARAAATRMAKERGERVGGTVGYRVRMDSKTSGRTRIEVVTEGILTRMLQDDPSLDGVGALVFDEFHERSVQADLGLALALEVQGALRPDLRLVVMSATLEGAAVARLLGEAPIIESEGRLFPVDVIWDAQRVEGRPEARVAQAVRRALDEQPEGDVLAFLPGAGEIRRAERMLADELPRHVDVRPLHGSLPLREQDRAVEPSPEGRRKVVLATDIAETSLTIEGVRTVVDAGLARVPRFDTASGMTRLATLPASQASAEQRAGRAGRTAPGVCYRLWTRADHTRRAPFSDPEIRHADLAPVALELAVWGARSPDDLPWLDPPVPTAFEQAQELLQQLGAIDGDGAATDHGRRLIRMGLHPRLAHLLVTAYDLGLGDVACDVAALLSERDPFRGTPEGPPDADLRLRLEALADVRTGRRPRSLGAYTVDVRALKRLDRTTQNLRRRLGLRDAPRAADAEHAGLLVALAYPDRIAQGREGQPERYRQRTGRAAVLPRPQALSGEPFLALAHLDGRRRESRIFLAAPLAQERLEAHFDDGLALAEHVTWDDEAGRVVARRQTRLGALVLSDGPLAEPDLDKVRAALLDGLRQRGLDVLPWTKKTRRLRERLLFLHHHAPDDWPDVRDDALLAILESWLGPHLYGLRRLDDVQRLDLHTVLQTTFLPDYAAQQRLDRLAPTHVTVPSGQRRPIDYSDPEAPVLAVRLQELFGQTETPRVLRGQVPLTLHLLSPAQRPVQVTQDLESFWREGYFDVRKDMRGRYPKHPWPEDPLSATPTHRAKRRS